VNAARRRRCRPDGAGEWGGAGGYKDFAPDGAAQIVFSSQRQSLSSTEMKMILFILCLFLTGINSQAQTTNSSSTAIPDTHKPIDHVAASAETTDKQIAVLQAQLDFMKDYDGRLLTTVYMALGGTFLMWTLINIAAYLTNRRDKEALMREIQDKTAAETTRLTGDITAKANALDEKLAAILSKNKKDLEQLVEAKAKIVTDDLSAQIASVKTQLDSSVRNLKTDLKESEYQFALIEAREWIKQGVHVNALRGYMTMLEISILREWPRRISNDLEEIQKMLKIILEEKKVKPDAETVRQLNVVLAKVPKDQEAIVTSIRKFIERITG
jgi:hypothetical protein